MDGYSTLGSWNCATQAYLMVAFAHCTWAASGLVRRLHTFNAEKHSRKTRASVLENCQRARRFTVQPKQGRRVPASSRSLLAISLLPMILSTSPTPPLHAGAGITTSPVQCANMARRLLR